MPDRIPVADPIVPAAGLLLAHVPVLGEEASVIEAPAHPVGPPVNAVGKGLPVIACEGCDTALNPLVAQYTVWR